jgi:hypothetical protein
VRVLSLQQIATAGVVLDHDHMGLRIRYVWGVIAAGDRCMLSKRDPTVPLVQTPTRCIQLNRSDNTMELIGAGCGRTGTLSLKV